MFWWRVIGRSYPRCSSNHLTQKIQGFATTISPRPPSFPCSAHPLASPLRRPSLPCVTIILLWRFVGCSSRLGKRVSSMPSRHFLLPTDLSSPSNGTLQSFRILLLPANVLISTSPGHASVPRRSFTHHKSYCMIFVRFLSSSSVNIPILFSDCDRRLL
jgi:hypothetical protein